MEMVMGRNRDWSVYIVGTQGTIDGNNVVESLKGRETTKLVVQSHYLQTDQQ